MIRPRLQRMRKNADPSESSTPTKDWWDKASIISGFLSSVVMAIVGLLITYTIQQAQIAVSAANTKALVDAATLKARDEKRLQEGQLTAQLVQHLASGENKQREIAIVALRTSVPRTTFDAIVEILARRDGSKDVRKIAIQELAASSSPTAAGTLNSIVRESVEADERQLAATSALQIGVREALHDIQPSGGSSVFVLAASNAENALETAELQQGVFTHFLLRGLRGEADTNRDRLIKSAELAEFVIRSVPEYTQKSSGFAQRPVSMMRGTEQVTLATVTEKGLMKSSGDIHGLFVGTSPRSSSFTPLRFAASDARAVAHLFEDIEGARVTVLLEGEATKTALMARLREIASASRDGDLVIFYFAGIGTVGADGVVRWLLADSESAETGISAAEINDFLERIVARKVLFIDSCHGGAMGRVGPTVVR